MGEEEASVASAPVATVAGLSCLPTHPALGLCMCPEGGCRVWSRRKLGVTHATVPTQPLVFLSKLEKRSIFLGRGSTGPCTNSDDEDGYTSPDLRRRGASVEDFLKGSELGKQVRGRGGYGRVSACRGGPAWVSVCRGLWAGPWQAWRLRDPAPLDACRASGL